MLGAFHGGVRLGPRGAGGGGGGPPLIRLGRSSVAQVSFAGVFNKRLNDFMLEESLSLLSESKRLSLSLDDSYPERLPLDRP